MDLFGNFRKVIGIKNQENNQNLNGIETSINGENNSTINLLKEESKFLKDKCNSLLKENELLKDSIFTTGNESNSNLGKIFKEFKTAFFSNEPNEETNKSIRNFKNFMFQNLLLFNSIDDEDSDLLNSISISETDWSKNKDLFLFKQNLLERNYNCLMENLAVSSEFNKFLNEDNLNEKQIEKTDMENGSIVKDKNKQNFIEENISLTNKDNKNMHNNSKDFERVKEVKKKEKETNLLENLLLDKTLEKMEEKEKEKENPYRRKLNSSASIDFKEKDKFNSDKSLINPENKNKAKDKNNTGINFDSLIDEDEIDFNTIKNLNKNTNLIDSFNNQEKEKEKNSEILKEKNLIKETPIAKKKNPFDDSDEEESEEIEIPIKIIQNENNEENSIELGNSKEVMDTQNVFDTPDSKINNINKNPINEVEKIVENLKEKNEVKAKEDNDKNPLEENERNSVKKDSNKFTDEFNVKKQEKKKQKEDNSLFSSNLFLIKLLNLF